MEEIEHLHYPEESHLQDKESYTPEEIDTIDVFWCNDCLSLKVRRLDVDTNFCYCDDCFSTEIEQGNIKSWEYLNELKKSKYGTKESRE